MIVRLDRRDLVWISVTTHPTAEWVARQITEAFPWNEAPRSAGRDRLVGGGLKVVGSGHGSLGAADMRQCFPRCSSGIKRCWPK